MYVRADDREECALERRLIDALADEALIALDSRGTLLRWNPGAERLYGRAAGERIDLALLYPPEDRALGAHRRELHAAATRGRQVRECWQARADGSRFYAQVSTAALRDEAGVLVGFARHARDVTERLRYEEKLRLSERRFQAIVELASEGIVAVDERQRILLFNRGAERIFGWRADEIVGEPLWRLVPERHRAAHAGHLEAFAASGEQARGMGERAEVYGVRKNGDVFPAEVSISMMRDGSGARMLTAVLRDVSARRAAEREIRRLLAAESEARARAEAALRARNDLLGVVAHDFGNALTAVGFQAYALQDSLGPGASDDDRRRASIILEMVDHLGRLQRDLVDSAAVEAGALALFPRDLDARHTVERAIDLYAAAATARGVSLAAELPPAALPVRADPDRLLQVVGNLVSNAIRHSPEGGTVTLAAEARDGAAVIRVADQGPGIPPEHLPHVFTAFWRGGAHAGTGLGLAIARGVAEAHGGTLSAANGAEGGAVFTATLPLAGPGGDGASGHG